MGQTSHRTVAHSAPRNQSLRLRHYAPYLLALVVLAVGVSGLLAAHSYIIYSLSSLHAVSVSAEPGSYYLDSAAQWWSGDAAHLEELAGEWPASLPALLGEIALLWRERETILEREALSTASGAKIVPADAAGRVHLLDVAIDARLAALANRWSRIAGEARLMQYYGYPIADARRVRIVEPEEVEKALDGAALPEGVLDGYRIVLLPFALENTAGIGTAGEAALGAAPDTGAVSPHRTAYTLLHELGHHVHFAYIDGNPDKDVLWQEYMALRGIGAWSESGQVESPAWVQSPQETFAEDFRLLFGDASARHFPHGTAYGDPTATSDGGEAVRSFMLKLMTSG